ncbi:histidine kinase, partial [Acinetobacter baumannii]
YRDGFRIGFTGGLNDDWLKMDSKALKSQGYTFNRYQTVGEISISKIKNPNLKDTASRQSLVNNNEFELLQDLISEIIIKDTKSRI